LLRFCFLLAFLGFCTTAGATTTWSGRGRTITGWIWMATLMFRQEASA